MTTTMTGLDPAPGTADPGRVNDLGAARPDPEVPERAHLAGLTKPRGRPRRDPQQEKITRLEQDKRQLEQELAKARFVVDVQAKLHALLETISESAATEPKSTP